MVQHNVHEILKLILWNIFHLKAIKGFQESYYIPLQF